ncbi:unnamed protein product [Lupinus luteus]|uniref:Uncharacterized protein n=1 Tax=Lupinus luteus TaxID=3873 RepID=A0AAV1WAV0_LUPLU
MDIFSRRPLIPVVGGELYVDLTISSQYLNANDSNMVVRDSGRDIENQSDSSVGQGNPNLTPPSSDPSVIRDQKKEKPKNKRRARVCCEN